MAAILSREMGETFGVEAGVNREKWISAMVTDVLVSWVPHTSAGMA